MLYAFRSIAFAAQQLWENKLFFFFCPDSDEVIDAFNFQEMRLTNIVCHIDSRGVQCRHAPSCALHLKHELNCNSTPKAGANRRPGPMYDPDFNDDDEAGPSTATLLQQSCAAMLLECAAAQNNLRAQILFPKKQRPCQGWQRGGRPFLCLRHAASEPQPRFLRRNDAMRADVEQLRAQLREATARETALQARPARLGRGRPPAQPCTTRTRAPPWPDACVRSNRTSGSHSQSCKNQTNQQTISSYVFVSRERCAGPHWQARITGDALEPQRDGATGRAPLATQPRAEEEGVQQAVLELSTRVEELELSLRELPKDDVQILRIDSAPGARHPLTPSVRERPTEPAAR